MTTAASSPSQVDPVLALANAQHVANSTKAGALPGTEMVLHGWSQELVKFLSVSILTFTLLALILSAILLWRSRATGFHVLRIFGVISILGISALLLVVGYSNEQLTPIVGLFGAIAGYLLGKDTTPLPATKTPANSTDPSPSRLSSTEA